MKNAAWIQHGHMGTKGTGYPLNNAILLHQGTLGVQIHHISRPVLNGGIAKPCTLSYKKFYASCMEVGYIIFRCTAALNKVQAGVFLQNNQGVLKLSCTCCIKAEIGLKRNIHMYSLRHINKGTAGPYGTVKGSKFVILWWNQLHKVFLYQILIIPQGCFHIRIYNTLLYQILLDAMVYHLRIILGTYTGQGGLLCLRNS